MNLHTAQSFVEIALIILSLAILTGAPLYMYLRKKMVKTEKSSDNYSSIHVVKLTLVNLFLISGTSLIFLLLFVFNLLHINTLSLPVLILSVLFLGALGLTFYGSGIYITSVVLEDYTLPQIRRLTQFKTQFLATHLFHGPISHIFVYSGFIIALFILSIINFAYSLAPVLFPQVILILSIFVGVVYAISQVFNGSLPYQFITSFVSLLTYSFIVSRLKGVLGMSPLGIYFLGFSFSFVITSLVYFIFLQSKGEKIDWDKSGYIHPDSKKY